MLAYMYSTLHICIKVRQAVAFEQARSRDGSKEAWIPTRTKGTIFHHVFFSSMVTLCMKYYGPLLRGRAKI